MTTGRINQGTVSRSGRKRQPRASLFTNKIFVRRACDRRPSISANRQTKCHFENSTTNEARPFYKSAGDLATFTAEAKSTIAFGSDTKRNLLLPLRSVRLKSFRTLNTADREERAPTKRVLVYKIFRRNRAHLHRRLHANGNRRTTAKGRRVPPAVGKRT